MITVWAIKPLIPMSHFLMFVMNVLIRRCEFADVAFVWLQIQMDPVNVLFHFSAVRKGFAALMTLKLFNLQMNPFIMLFNTALPKGRIGTVWKMTRSLVLFSFLGI